MTTQPKLCLVEDDLIMGESLCERFTLEGFAFDWHHSAESAMRKIGREPYAAVISDIRLPDFSGEDLFRRLLAQHVRLPPWIFLTAYGSIDRAVEALKLGATDYVTKPFDIEKLIEKTRAAVGLADANNEDSRVQSELGVSQAMQRIADLLPRIARQANTVLITGESGVGKEKVAQLLHRSHEPTANAPFIGVNCSAFAESLLESELFGYERGAFTGAQRTRRGVFEQAEDGTLFLDEIGDMPASMQAKLLRALQERQIVRVGGERTIPVKIRLVCASNQDLRKLVEQGRFREDLYYRINLVQLRIPPLRERREDVLWLARNFLAQYCDESEGGPKRFSPAAESALVRHEWPGNVRELKHCVQRTCILSPHPIIEPWDLFEEIAALEPGAAGEHEKLAEYLHACEREYIMRALQAHRGQIAETAAALGISRKNLWEKMRKLQILAKQEW